MQPNDLFIVDGECGSGKSFSSLFMLEVLIRTDDLTAVYCTPTVDLLLRNSLVLLKKLVKTLAPKLKEHLVIVCSSAAQSKYEDHLKYFTDNLIENKALK